MRLSEIGSLRSFAQNIVAANEAGKTALVHFPTDAAYNDWADTFKNALDAVATQSMYGEIYQKFSLNDYSNYNELILQICGSDEKIEDFLNCYGPEPIILIWPKLLGSVELWRRFIKEINQIQKSTGSSSHLRHLIVMLVGSEVPIEFNTPNVQVFQVWNPIRWEECRLFVREYLGVDANVARYAWMVSTYTGASNYNPTQLEVLCAKRPVSIDEICQISTGNHASIIFNDRRISSISLDRQWLVPKSARESWLSGRISGAMFERGVIEELDSLTPDARQRVIRKRIWQEQLAGLMPLVIEVSQFINQLIDNSIGDDWRHGFAQDIRCNFEDTYFAEPGSLYGYLKSSRSVFIPQTQFELLRNLRFIRNKLAHIRAINLKECISLWDLYQRCLLG
jgi:hypothetical protein